MFKFLISFLISLLASNLSYAEQSNLSTEDRYVAVALKNDVKTLKGSGPYVCRYDKLVNIYGTDPVYESRGNTLEEARLRLDLLCVKERCQQVGQWILGALSDLDQVSKSDTIDLLISRAYSDSEISTILKNQEEQDRSNIKTITCATSSPTSHIVIVTSCTSSPKLLNCSAK